MGQRRLCNINSRRGSKIKVYLRKARYDTTKLKDVEISTYDIEVNSETSELVIESDDLTFTSQKITDVITQLVDQITKIERITLELNSKEKTFN